MSHANLCLLPVKKYGPRDTMKNLKKKADHKCRKVWRRACVFTIVFLTLAFFTPIIQGESPSPYGDQRVSYQTSPLLLAQAEEQQPTSSQRATEPSPKATTANKPPGDSNKPDSNAQTEEKTEFEKLLDKEYGQTEVKTPEETSWLSQVVKTLFALLFLTGLLYLIWKVLLFKKSLPGQGSEVIKLLHERAIGTGKNLHLVELDGRLLLLSESETGLRLLTEYSDPTQVERIKLECDKDEAREKPDFWIELSKNMTRSFGQILGKSMQGPETNGHNPWENTRQSAKKRLENLKNGRAKIYDNDDE